MFPIMDIDFHILAAARYDFALFVLISMPYTRAIFESC